MKTTEPQPTLQDCVDELQKIKVEQPSDSTLRARITTVQYMIQSVSEAVLNSNCNKAMEDYERLQKIENIEERRKALKEWADT